MAECKKLIIRNESGADVKVLWYPGSTDESIESCIKAALGLQPHDEVDVCDAKDGTHLAINENLPDGLVVAVNRYTKQPTNLAPPVLRESATEDWLDTNTTKGEGVPLLTDPDNAADNGESGVRHSRQPRGIWRHYQQLQQPTQFTPTKLTHHLQR
jgi:hypothetical protein